MADPRGQAGAYGAWFARVRRELGALPPSDDYSPARDLTLIFTSPLYTHCDEKAPPGVWETETEYFETLSRCVGPARGVEFGFREQFLDERGRPKIALLRERLDRAGNGHGIHVIAFCGGDNYLSDDPANISGTLAHLYRGAESVCLSTGGLHEEPVQMLNADCLWNGSAGGRRETPRTDREAAAILREIAAGARRPPEIFGAGGYFDRLCARLWGPEAGRAMARALTVRAGGRAPVGHVWWTVTKAVAALAGNTDPARTWEREIREYADRERATASALRHARRAACLSDSEDIRRFVRCLEIGGRFAQAVRLLLLLKSRRTHPGADRLRARLASLERSIRRLPDRRTDILGGDPGCWMETLATMRNLSRAGRQPAARRGGGSMP